MMLRAEVLCSESLKQHVVDCKQKQKHLKLFDWHFSLSTFQKKQKKLGAAWTFRGGSQVFKKNVGFFTVYIERSVCVDRQRVSTQKSMMSDFEVLCSGFSNRHIVDCKQKQKHSTLFD